MSVILQTAIEHMYTPQSVETRFVFSVWTETLDMDADSNSMLLKTPFLLFPTQPLPLGYRAHSAESSPGLPHQHPMIYWTTFSKTFNSNG